MPIALVRGGRGAWEEGGARPAETSRFPLGVDGGTACLLTSLPLAHLVHADPALRLLGGSQADSHLPQSGCDVMRGLVVLSVLLLAASCRAGACGGV